MSKGSLCDIVIAGGGIIGLSLGMELRLRGVSVVVLERERGMRSASWAAGGMLAAHDPENPSALLPLSLRSLELYPEYLERIESLSRHPIAIRTRRTLQLIESRVYKEQFGAACTVTEQGCSEIPGLHDNCAGGRDHGWIWLDEQSLDPRDLCVALPAAYLALQGTLREQTSVQNVRRASGGVVVQTDRGDIHAGTFVNCCGAWAGKLPPGDAPVEPVKGQMVTVWLAPERLECVLRTPDFYAIPRGDGRVVIGATVEHAGFDPELKDESLAGLVRMVAEYLPEVGDAPRLESWAGFRPGTPDGLPILGPAAMKNCWCATGHFRNGILLAPVTARVLAQAIFRESPEVALDAFSPMRFQ